MKHDFTKVAFTETTRSWQEKMGSRSVYAGVEDQGGTTGMDEGTMEFIKNRDAFYISTVNSEGWPYLQYRGGPKGFLRIIDDSTLAFPDYGGNRQYLRTANIADTHKAMLFLMDYPLRARLKIWAQAEVHSTKDRPDLLHWFEGQVHPKPMERVFILDIKGMDWNCPQHIQQRFTLEEILDSPILMETIQERSKWGPIP